MPEFELQRLAARVAKCEEERAQAEITRARAKTLLYNRIIARDEMAMAVSVAYQKAEEERLDQLNSCLQRYAHVERERLRAADKTLAAFEARVASASRAEDIQLFIDVRTSVDLHVRTCQIDLSPLTMVLALVQNHRDPDNLHFQGKALALLDWQWSKTHAPVRRRDGGEVTLKPPPQLSDGLFEARSSWDEQQEDEDARDGVAISRPSGNSHQSVAATSQASSTSSAALGMLTQTPMGAALHQYFAQEPHSSDRDTGQYTGVSATGDGDKSNTTHTVGTESVPASALVIDAPTDAVASPSASPLSPRPPEPVFDGKKIVRLACRSAAGRAMFVKCLNQQRSLETRIKDRASFDALVSCTNAFLDECVRENDIKAAKTAMILAETFYVAREEGRARATSSSSHGAVSVNGDVDAGEANAQAASDSDAPPRRERRESANEALLHSVEDAHPALLQRGAARMYLQEEVKKHAIWKNPSVSPILGSAVRVTHTSSNNGLTSHVIIYLAVVMSAVLGEGVAARDPGRAAQDAAAVSMGRAAQRHTQAQRCVLDHSLTFA